MGRGAFSLVERASSYYPRLTAGLVGWGAWYEQLNDGFFLKKKVAIQKIVNLLLLIENSAVHNLSAPHRRGARS